MNSVSIIIPLFNKAAYLALTLDALIPQLAPGDEIIVVDDRSTDAGPAIVTRRSGSNVQLHTMPQNGGPATARNAGAARARGQYLLFFDADDLPHPQLLAVLKQSLARHPDACVFAFDLATQARGEVADLAPERPLTAAATTVLERDAFVQSCLRGKPVCTASSTCVRATEFLAAGGFQPGLRYCEDPELWARLSARHNIVHIDATLALYRDVPMSLSYGLRAQPGSVQPYVNTLLSLASHPDDAYHRLARTMIAKNVIFGMTMGAERAAILRYLATTTAILSTPQRLGLQLLVVLPRQLLALPFQLRAWIAGRRLQRQRGAGPSAR